MNKYFNTWITFLFLISFISTSLYPSNAIADTITTFSPSSCNLGSLDLVEHMSSEIDIRIDGLTADNTTKNVFSVRGNSSGGWTRNPSVWTNQGTSSIDLTGISPWNSDGGYNKAGVLITPQHIAFANHYAIADGATIVFVDNDGNTITRTMASSSRIGAYDINIGVLDSPVPTSTITYYPILTLSQVNSYIEYSGREDIPILVFDQEDKAIIHETTGATNDSYLEHNAPASTSTRYAFYEDLGLGDSGDSAFMIIDSKPVLVLTHSTSGDGPNYPAFRNLVNSKLNELGSPYDVSEYNLDCFISIPDTGTYTFSVDEYSSIGAVVGNVTATGTVGHDLNWDITSGDSDSLFSFDTEGNILIASSTIDSSVDNTFNLTVSISYINELYSNFTVTTPVTININDINLSPTFENQTFSINENSPNSTVVGTVSASDRDSGQTLTYSINSGNAGDSFVINSSTGQITVNNNEFLDYEERTSFTLIAQVTDDGSPTQSDTATITINLNDLGDGDSGGGGGGGGGGSNRTTTTTITDPIATFLSLPPLSSNPTKSELEERVEILKQVLTKLIELKSKTPSLNTSFNTSSTKYIFTRDLELGSIGEDVRQLQKLLNSKGFIISQSGPGSIGNETTIFGPATQSALIRFQISNSVSPASGYFGIITRSLINKL